jgi:hypothetical protein
MIILGTRLGFLFGVCFTWQHELHLFDKHHLLGCCMYSWPRGLPSSSLPDFQSPTLSISLANLLAIPLWGSPTLETKSLHHKQGISGSS